MVVISSGFRQAAIFRRRPFVAGRPNALSSGMLLGEMRFRVRLTDPQRKARRRRHAIVLLSSYHLGSTAAENQRRPPHIVVCQRASADRRRFRIDVQPFMMRAIRIGRPTQLTGKVGNRVWRCIYAFIIDIDRVGAFGLVLIIRAVG